MGMRGLTNPRALHTQLALLGGFLIACVVVAGLIWAFVNHGWRVTGATPPSAVVSESHRLVKKEGTYELVITFENDGNAAATDLKFSEANLGGIPATGLPIHLGTIPKRSKREVVLKFEGLPSSDKPVLLNLDYEFWSGREGRGSGLTDMIVLPKD
jgi:hypothetical protein